MRFIENSLKVQLNNEEFDIVKNRWMEANALIAISSNRKLWDDINEQYAAIESDAIQSYKNSDFYEMPVLNTLTVPVKAMTIKVHSIYAYHDERDASLEWIKEMANRSYKRYIDYVKNNKERFSWEMFFEFMERRDPNFSASQHDHLMLLILVCFGKDLFGSIQSSFGRNLLFNVYQSNRILGVPNNDFIQLREKYKKEALFHLKDAFKFKIPPSQSVDWFFQQHEAYIINNLLTKEERTTIVSKGDYDVLYNKGLLRYYKTLTGTLRQERLNDFNLTTSAEVKREDLVGIYAIFKYGVETGRLSDEQWELFLTSSVLILMMVKHYKELSDFYFQSLKDKEELVIREQDIIRTKRELETEKESFEKNTREMERLLSEKDEYILQLEEQVKQMRNRQEETSSLKKEVTALRNYAYHQRAETPEHHQKVDVVEQVTQLMKENKAVLFGGHPQLVNKLKKAIPSMDYRDVDSLNRDISFISNMDIVFVLTNYFNHPFYYKLMGELEKYPHVKLVYLSGYPNLERTMKEMVELAEA